jgi:hypothetical protein
MTSAQATLDLERSNLTSLSARFVQIVRTMALQDEQATSIGLKVPATDLSILRSLSDDDVQALVARGGVRLRVDSSLLNALRAANASRRTS